MGVTYYQHPTPFEYSGFETLPFNKEFAQNFINYKYEKGLDWQQVKDKQRALFVQSIFPAIVGQVLDAVEFCKSIPNIQSRIDLTLRLFEVNVPQSGVKVISTKSEVVSLSVKIDKYGQIKKLFLSYRTYMVDLTTNNIQIWLTRPDTVEEMLALSSKIWVLLDTNNALIDTVGSFIICNENQF